MPTSLYHVIGGASGWGAQHVETESGPEAIYRAYAEPLAERYGVCFQEMLYPAVRYADASLPRTEKRLPIIAAHCNDLAHAVQKSLHAGAFPIVLGGDHAIAAGTWSGVTHALKAEQSFGLMWIDAHMDAHTPKTTPSYAYHGMPVAALLGYGPAALTHIASPVPKLNPKNLALVGIRSFEKGEHALLTGLGVRIFYMEEVHRRGVQACIEEALRIVTKGTKGFGVSLDLDAFDPSTVPGVGSPEPDGLWPDEVLPALATCAQHPLLRAFELVELNPVLDREDQTLTLAGRVLETFLDTHHSVGKS